MRCDMICYDVICDDNILFVDIGGHAELQKICVKVNSKRHLAAAATVLVTIIPSPEVIKVCTCTLMNANKERIALNLIFQI